MGLQHSTERPYRKEYEEEKYDSMSVREDVEKGDDMIARTLVISVKKSPSKKKTSPMKRKTTPKRKASPMKRKTTPKKKTTPKRKMTPKKKTTPKRKMTGKPRKTSGKKK